MLSRWCLHRVSNCFSVLIRHKSRKMAENNSFESKPAFVHRFNAITGKFEWELQDENYDFHQEIARSAFADMLHDTERNKKYFTGLKWAICQLRFEGKPVRVLDIGTGTGLLSLMAASLGADEITACEAFAPMAKCARQIIEQNGYKDKIRLIPKRSTEITVGSGCDMLQRANLLVTEVFDTELIGEGAISTFNHAHKMLLEKHCLVVPSKATIYVQVVESELLWSRNRPKPLMILKSDEFLIPPTEIERCPGSTAVLDLQMSQLPEESLNFITDPLPVSNFDFSGSSAIPISDKTITEIHAHRTGRCDAILFWWNLEMDGSGKCQLSCAPWWCHDKSKDQPWRDHWMQAVYFPTQPVTVQKGEIVMLSCCHDEYSFWFDITADKSIQKIPVSGDQIERPICMCGFHNVCNPSRIGMINDCDLNKKYIDVLQKVVNPSTVCAFFGSGCSMLPLIVAKLGAKKVYAIDSEFLSRVTLSAFVRKNNMEDKIKVMDNNFTEEDFDGIEVDIFLSEPYFLSSLLPWDNLHFSYALEGLKATHKATISHSLPILGKLWAIGMDFLHLFKIRAPLDEVEGFNMQYFDEVIQKSSHIADHHVEPHHLWEYGGVALMKPFVLLTFDMTEPLNKDGLTISGFEPFLSSRTCNGVALWMEWFLDGDISISRGPVKPIIPTQTVSWDPHSKQGVYFIPDPQNVTGKQLHYDATFKTITGSLELKFSIK